MAIPTDAFIVKDTLDPADIDFVPIDCSPLPLLSGETIIAYDLLIMTESALVGVREGTGLYATRQIGPTLFVFWPYIEPTMLSDAIFAKQVITPFIMTVDTDGGGVIPPRRFQRTFATKWVQR